MDSFRLSSEAWSILAALLAAVLAYKIWTDHKFKLPPLINPPKSFDLSGAAVKKDFVQRSNELIQEGLKAFGGEPYSVISDTGRVIMLAPKHVDEIRNDPKLSFLKNTEHDFHAYLPGFEPFGAGNAIQILIMVAKKQLTKFLAKITKPLSDETAFSFQTVLGDSTEWHEVGLGHSILNIVSRLSSRVFLGPEICRNEEWLNITVMYVVDSFIAAERLRIVPKPLRRIVHWFLPECQRVRSHVAQTRSIIQPVIDARAREKRAAAQEGRPIPTHDDAIQWGEEESARSKYDPAIYQLAMAGAAIHTTTDLMTQLILNILPRPELLAALRSEMIDVLGKEGWAKTSLYNLKLMDSVMKETQRMKPIQSISMGRIADADVHLSDGTVIPKGMKVAVANTSRHDPTIYESPLEFDGYRFLRMRQTPGKENQAHFVTTSPDSLGFGHGQHACPGRFFAANEVKIAMCHLLLKYDLELVPGSDSSVQVHGFSLNSNRGAKIRSLYILATLKMSILLPLTAALAAVVYGPTQFTDKIVESRFGALIHGRDGAKVLLGLAVGLGVVKTINNLSNKVALNNWRVRAHKGWIWNKEVAVVTGGCGGIGRELVLGLVKKGVKVAILDLAPIPPDMESDPAILYIKTDITSAEAIAQAAKTIRTSFGAPSILINNAGIASPHTILDTPADFLPKLFGVNAIALWIVTKEFLPSMIKKNKGHIVNISSITAHITLSSLVDYCASKAASVTFHEGLNCELKTKYKADGIITTIVQPSWVRTNMSPKNADEIEEKQGKMLSPKEVADRTLAQVFACRGAQIVLPEKVWFFTTLRAWPNWMQEWMRDRMGKASLL
ncbi:Cytochrome P450 monooygenase 1 [Colletotrichum sp. SAR 10_66]|nr:Cytochrome P450 monooygenase 1 [Colletotrichum sp. SAR 10_66]